MNSRYELATILFLPWIVDFLLDSSIMASLLGSLIWGLTVLLTLLKVRLKEKSLKKKLTYISMFLLGSWSSLCLLATDGSINATWGERGLRLLTISHAALLTAGFGMVVILLLSSVLWIIKEWGLKNKKTFRQLPSLEALSKSSQLAMRSSFWFWSTGLFFAVLTALLRWQGLHNEAAIGTLLHYEWLSDPKVLLSITLWFPLLFCRLFRQLFTDSHSFRYRGFSIFAFIFVLIFVFMTSTDLPLSQHETLRWLTR